MSRTEDTYAAIRQLEVATAAHDLRNRMSIARCQVRQLRCQLQTSAFDPSIQNSLVLVERSLARTNKLLEDLLEVTAEKVRVPVTTRRTGDIISLARRMIAEDPRIGRHSQVALITTLRRLVGAWDVRRLAVVLQILLDNAIKYTPNGGCVTIEIEANDECATIVFRDHGPCIPPEELPHAFEPFVHGRSVTSLDAGLGLGLATARLIVEQYAGVLDVECNESEGNTFTVRLPIISA